MKDAPSRALSEFKRLSPAKQAAIVAITAWNLWLTVTSERDIQRRSPDQVRGPKMLWRLACLTNSVGPLSYFQWGRRPTNR
jgi:hypothetical protein